MKEHPILFSGAMVRALLAGTKTQTRRAAKPVRHPDLGNLYTPGALVLEHEPQHVIERACPYGRPGDRLWVREAFDFLPTGAPDDPQACEIVYWATGSHEPRIAPLNYNPMIYGREKVRPSIHMPRWASRITLEITAVRAERLQDISDEDALAEGVAQIVRDRLPMQLCGEYDAIDADAVALYCDLWEQINGPGSWDANPWVWVVEFKRLHEAAA